jgi:hypothetical protein
MLFEPSGSCPPVQQSRSKRCRVCRQARPLPDFSTNGRGSLADSCRDCRRAAAMPLLIAAHPAEGAGLLGLVRGRHQAGASHAWGGGRRA